MTATLWIRLFVAILIFVSAILGWRILKCSDSEKRWPWILALIAAVVAMVLGPHLYHRAEDARKQEAEQRKAEQQLAVSVKQTAPTHYRWHWKLPDGVDVHGRNESDGNNPFAELIPRSDDSIWADFHYVEYGRQETERIRLSRTVGSTNTWSGTFEQDNPEEHGRIEVDQVVPGIWAGDKIWAWHGSEKRGRCYLILTK